MRKRMRTCIAFVFASIIVFSLLLFFPREESDFLPNDDEVGLAELQKFAIKYDLKISDFEQPTIWVQKSAVAKKDPRGPCVTICYKTKQDVNPRHILLLYLTPRRGIIDEESMVEEFADCDPQNQMTEGKCHEQE